MQAHGLARLGRDAEVRFTPGGDAVATLSLAFSYGKKGQDGKRPTQWVDGELWGKGAEALAPYLLKGTQIAVTLDDVHVKTFDKKDGTQGVKLAGRVSLVELASSGERTTTQPPIQAPAPTPAAPRTRGTFDNMDDDIPF